ncbi:MAG: hypothetical protein MJZ24_07020 [Paludibacteraceae bacterium]|nr:hypothetical protein [Candidatus Physcocola equi]MCQ2234469.1 hypothetical protein [Paludibacteraceae bacterium]
MKKYLLMLATAVVALGFASCSNEEEDETPAPKSEIKLNISVCNLDGGNDDNGGVSTKAAKSGWVNGDKINIWYDENFGEKPDLVIKYNGTNWTIDTEVETSENVPSASGTIKFLYEGYNDLSKYIVTSPSSSSTKWGETFNLTFGSERYSAEYTYEDGTISFSINKWIPLSEFQVVVTGIAADEYELKCDALLKAAGFIVNSKGVSTSNSAYNYYTNGVANADGAAFYFRANKSDNYTFTLKNKTTGVEYTYTATGKSHSQYTFTAVKIDKSKFGL